MLGPAMRNVLPDRVSCWPERLTNAVGLGSVPVPETVEAPPVYLGAQTGWVVVEEVVVEVEDAGEDEGGRETVAVEMEVELEEVVVVVVLEVVAAVEVVAAAREDDE